MALSRLSLVFLITFSSLMACHRVQKQNADAGPGRSWSSKLIAQDRDGRLKIYEHSLGGSELEAGRAVYSGTALADYPIEPGYRAALKQLAGVPEFADTVFIEPSLHIFNSVQAPFTIKRDPSGRWLVSFYGVFFDGLSSHVPSLTPGERVAVTIASKVNESEKLRSVLEKSGKSAVFLNGCLEQVELTVGEMGYPVTAEFVGADSKSGVCDIENRVLHFSAMVDNEKWPTIFAAGAQVALNAKYKATVPMVSKKRTIEVENSFLRAIADRSLSSAGTSDAELDRQMRQALSDAKIEDVIKTAFGPQADEALKRLTAALKEKDWERSSSSTLVVTVYEAENVALTKRHTLWPKLRPIVIARAEISHLLKGATFETGIEVPRGAVIAIESSQVEIEKRLRERFEVAYGVAGPENIWVAKPSWVHCGNDNEPGCAFGKKQADLGHWEYHLFRSRELGPEAVPYFASNAPVASLAADFFGGVALIPKRGRIDCSISPTTLASAIEGNKITVVVSDTSTCAPWRDLADGERVGLTIANRINASPVTVTGPVLIQQYNESVPSSEMTEGPLTYSPHLRLNGAVVVYGLEAYR